jgi:hypothetical protein
MDCLENGQHLRRVWRHRTQEGIKLRFGDLEWLRSIPEPGEGMMWTAAPRKAGLSDEFVQALEASTDTDMSPLADYIASDKPLSKEEREVLSRKLPKRKTGRPKNSQLRGAASMAWMFYQEWRKLNKELGVSDRGCGDDMKGYSAQWVVEDYFEWGGEEFTANDRTDKFTVSVRELMEKPKHLRGGVDRCILTFPAHGWDDDHQN